MAKLTEGSKAPDFRLPSTEGKDISLSDFRGKKNVVLYFYPKDDTPGCTKEACDFRDHLQSLNRSDAVVLGLSADPVASHHKFREKYRLPFPLLSDETKKVIQQYDVWKEKNMYGKKMMGVVRTTVLIDKSGVVRKIFPKVKVEGHVEQVNQALNEL